ncbi:hypothetical protein Clacol_009056 [Clathrus columnatus]|uniref:Cytochrome P450 n=1 Tax=Clathrus columnatus TaxID=1419009 RepID=A0AAV5AQ28_9AGAM|nr:hypothetical protein Clacol_009056 [Clathrus columnatus]
MRDLLPVIQPIANKLLEIFQSQIPQNGSTREINIYPWMIRAAMEYICQAGFGYTFNALEDENNEYVNAVRNLTPTAAKIILYRPFVPLAYRYLSPYWRNKLVDWMPQQGFRDMRRIAETIHDTGKKILAEKKAAFESNWDDGPAKPRAKGDLGERMRGRDLASIMLRASKSASEKDSLSEAEFLGQLNTILFAGFETTAISVARILHMLAIQPVYQKRLRSEIRITKQKYAEMSASNVDTGWEQVELPYDTLMSMPLLDAIVRETLRVFPPTTVLSRTVRKSTVLPLQFPVRAENGSRLSAIPLEENTNVIISILGANHNKDIWGEDASNWRPERWLNLAGEINELGKMDYTSFKTSIDGTTKQQEIRYPGVYGSMMTFLGGGRACMYANNGFKFSEMEAKQVLVTLLSSLHFSLTSALDEKGNVKVVRWRTDGIQKPVLCPPSGNDVTPQMPMDVRAVTADDFYD